MSVETEGGDIMVRLSGATHSFRCDNVERVGGNQCGANVFRRKKGEPSRLVCNACGAVYITERAS